MRLQRLAHAVSPCRRLVPQKSGPGIRSGLTRALPAGAARAACSVTPAWTCAPRPAQSAGATPTSLAKPVLPAGRQSPHALAWTRGFSLTATRSEQDRKPASSKDSGGGGGGGDGGSRNPAPAPGPAAPLARIRNALPIKSLTPHENIYTVPNLLTFSRLVVAPAIGYAILQDAHGWALGLFMYAGVSDLLDGWIARRWNLQTVVGSVVDPMADKILMTVLTVCLATQGSLPVWLAVIILGRDVGLAIAAIYYRWISLPPPKTFSRYWDFSLPSAEVRPTTISKYNTFLQLALMGATMVSPLVAADLAGAMLAFQYTVAATTIWSGLSYVFSKDAVKILSDNKGSGKK